MFHHNFVTWLVANGYNLDEVSHMDEQELKAEIIALSPFFIKLQPTMLTGVAKVKMQGAIQKWVDHSISVTVNVPNGGKR